MIRVSAILSKCVVWITILLLPAQALLAMHVFCSPCDSCEASNSDATPFSTTPCCCPSKVDSRHRTDTSSFGGIQPFSPCSCPPSCWCHRLSQPLHSQVIFKTHETVEPSIAPLESSIVIHNVLTHIRRKMDALTVFPTQPICVSLCRFQA
jgi:hypothetical protein